MCHVAHSFRAVCVARHRPVSEALAHLNRTGDMSRLSAATCSLCRRHWPDSAFEGEIFTAFLAHLGFPLPETGCPCGGCRAAGAGPEDSDVDDMWFAAVHLVAAQGEDEVIPGDLAPELVEQPLVLAAPMVPLAPPPEPEPLAPPPEPEPQEQPRGPALAPEPKQPEPQRVVPQHRVAHLANGWHHLAWIVLDEELRIRTHTMRAVPSPIRGAYARIQTQVLAHLVRAYDRYPQHEAPEGVAAWTLFMLLPGLLLYKAGRGGKNGARELQRRVTLFDAGQWDVLLDASRASRATHPAGRLPRDPPRQVEVHGACAKNPGHIRRAPRPASPGPPRPLATRGHRVPTS